MKCSKCNTKISQVHSRCPLCGTKVKCKIYRNSPKFYVSIIISVIIIYAVTGVILEVNSFYWILGGIISGIFVGWGIISYLITFFLNDEGITYYHPLKKTVTIKWEEIDEFTVYKESAQKTLFPKKIYTLKSTASGKKIAFHEMKHSMEGYERFMAAIVARTKIYPQNKSM